MQRIEFGKYIVVDPNICHGALIFNGTRIFVQDVIEMVADGMEWNTIVAEWDGVINHEAIAQAVRLMGKTLVEVSKQRIAGGSRSNRPERKSKDQTKSSVAFC